MKYEDYIGIEISYTLYTKYGSETEPIYDGTITFQK